MDFTECLRYIDRKVYYKRQDIIRFMEAEIHRVTPLNRMI